MAVSRVPEADRAAAARWGQLVNGVAAGYTNPTTGKPLSGAALLLKLASGESHFDSDATSPKGAHGRTQFMPGSRQEVLKLTGGKVDAWGSVDDAYHAAALHLLGKVNNQKGLEGYNPGDPSYTSYILGQKIGGATKGAASTASPGASAPPTGDQSAAGSGLGSPASTAGVSALLAAMQQPQQPRTVAGLQAPSFSAQPTLAAGAQVPVSGGGAPRSSGVDALLAAAGQAADTSSPQSAIARQAHAFGSGGGGAAAPGGDFKPGDPVEGGTSIGGRHATAGLAGYPARDYFAPAGSTAVAPVSGTVIKLSGHDPKKGPTNGPHGPLGWSVYIKGTDGKTYFLTHMGSRNVKPGEKVKAGTPIGTVADYDKYGTPSHIHMGVAG